MFRINKNLIIKKLRDIFDSDEKLIFICAASIFLPFYLCSAVCLIAFVYILFTREKVSSRFLTPHSCWFYAFSAFALAIGAIHKNWLGILMYEMLFAAVLFGFYLQSVMTEDITKIIFKIVACGSIVAAVAALIQKFPVITFRSVSFFGNANYYAYVCELAIIALVYALYKYGKNILYIAAIISNICGIICSGCRTAWPAFFCGVIVILICAKKYLHLTVFTAAGVLAGACVKFLPQIIFPRYKDFYSDKNLRFLIWNTAIKQIKSHIFFGQGMQTYYFVSSGRAFDFHAHNLILDVLINFGIVGAALITVYTVYVVIGLIRRLHYNSANAVALAILMSTFVHGITDLPFMGVQTGMMFIILFALSGREKAVRQINPLV